MNQYNPYSVYNPFVNPYQQGGNGGNAIANMTAPLNGNVLRVSGINGVNALNIAPNASVLALDDTAPILWFVQTDSAGYKTPIPYDITPHVDQAAKIEQNFEERLKRLEDYVNEQSNIVANANTAKRSKSSIDSTD